MVRTVLECIVAPEGQFVYDDIPNEWRMSDVRYFSKAKQLFSYQVSALKNIASVLFYRFDKTLNKDIDFLSEQYRLHGYNNDSSLHLNRACFWMATGSGKTLSLIKTIEHVDRLIKKGLIPNNDILILSPKDVLLNQLKKEVSEFNQDRNRKISLINLIDYEKDKYESLKLDDVIRVYYYRSDLIRNEKKEKILNYETYLNNGNWYVFLDEAHRGDGEYSNIKGYVNELTKNGFLFNYSATFTDEIDIITTCYNFNLDKFITSGYGKNIYLSESNFRFRRNGKVDEFDETDKQKQVIKSFIIFAILKGSKKIGAYHNPLMLTLVNSVQKNAKTENSDLKLFCKYMLSIAQNNKELDDLVQLAKEELKVEFSVEKKYRFGNESLLIPSRLIDSITLDAIRKAVFNSNTCGNLEYYEGEKGKEIVLKLTTSAEPFALIKIGDTSTFIKTYLIGYQKLLTFEPIKYMDTINSETSPINVLLGSRSFYEGWDSNRPNIINMINIGSGDAKKFVPQSIGRGIRIQPDMHNVSNRKRLYESDPNKNRLLETLFIFPTDKKSIETVLSAMTDLGESEINTEVIKLFEKANLKHPEQTFFDLLIPEYEDSEDEDDSSCIEFILSQTNKVNLTSLLQEMSPSVFLLQNHKSIKETWTLANYKKLIAFDKYKEDITKDYHNVYDLFENLKKCISLKKKNFKRFRKVVEDDINHYKQIKINLDGGKAAELIEVVERVYNYNKIPQDEIMKKATGRDGRIDFEKAAKLSGVSNKDFTENNQTIHIRNIREHYYNPLIYAETEQVDFINHIIKNASETEFIKNLIDYISVSKIDFDWQFSKIDESSDLEWGMPYLSDSEYHNFYPDFVFWLKKGPNYKIIFVDPKGGTQASSEKKIDGFVDLFSNSSEKTNVLIELKMIGNWSGGDRYKKYWTEQNDFSWFNMDD